MVSLRHLLPLVSRNPSFNFTKVGLAADKILDWLIDASVVVLVVCLLGVGPLLISRLLLKVRLSLIDLN